MLPFFCVKLCRTSLDKVGIYLTEQVVNRDLNAWNKKKRRGFPTLLKKLDYVILYVHSNVEQSCCQHNIPMSRFQTAHHVIRSTGC